MKKKRIIVIILLIIIALLGVGIFYLLNHQDENNLTLLEKEWIDKNKNNRIDFAISSSIPIFSYNGEGVLYDYLDSLEKDTGLEFNKIPYKEETKYAFHETDKPAKNDIVLYEDNYAIVTKDSKNYDNLADLKNLTIGVLESKVDEVTKYLNNSSLSYKTYESNDALFENLLSEDSEVDGIVVPKVLYINKLLEDDLNIAYNITEMKESLVIKLGDDKKLNDILTKYYQKWKDEEYDESYNKNFLNTYYEFTNYEDDVKVKFKSKRYKYGFVKNPPYDALINGSLVGINSKILADYSKISGVEISFTEYDSYAELVNAFNKNEIDFFFNQTSKNKYDVDIFNTVTINQEEIVILSHIDNSLILNSLKSVNDIVKTISNSKINNYLKKQGINTKTYKNIDKLLKSLNTKSILALDYKTYDIYKSSALKDYKIDYEFRMDDSYYTSRDIKDNKLFNSFFNFYLSYINEKEYVNQINYKTFVEANKFSFVKPLIFTLFAISGLLIIALIIKKVKNNRKTTNNIAKEDKLKYIDMLTSLKNRNFLNDSMEKWDESEVYPQAIVIADLNNIAYINDNYGHNEGDNVIKEAANILIKNQLEQSEIIRTSGNEFLIYLVGYEEKQIVSYMKKLNKEFKELEHGFGAALGYSIISDGLKTVDDAINEATLDMRTNKEEAE